MSRAAVLLDRLGRPGDIRLGAARPEAIAAAPAAWPRLARAAERTRTSLLVVAPRRAAGTYAAVGLELSARRVRWHGGPGRLVLLEGVDARVTIARSRVGRPGQTLVV